MSVFTGSELTPLDATFLELEDIHEGSTMHIGGALLFEPVPGTGGAPSTEALLGLLRERLGSLPLFSCRLSAAHTANLDRPAWVPDPAFDPADHLTRVAIPAPGDRAALDAFLSDFWSHRLDRSRPLWEMALLEGLEGGRWALVTKTHHAMVDGVGSIDIGYALLDLEPHPSGHHDGAGPDVASLGEVRRPALPLRPVSAASRFARAGLHAAAHPRKTLGDAAALAGVVWRDEINAAPASSINVPITATRRFQSVDAGLDEVKAIKRVLGGTVNDVILAAVAGGLRRLLLARGDETPRMRAMVPVNVRSQDETGALGNRVTSLFVELAVDEPDLLERYKATRDAAEELKSSDAARGGSALIDFTGYLPPAIHKPVSRMLFAARLFNLTITNVPGAQVPLYAFGARMENVLPLVPLFEGHSLAVAILSYDGHLCFGCNGDRAAVTDLHVFADGIRAELDALAALASERDAAS